MMPRPRKALTARGKLISAAVCRYQIEKMCRAIDAPQEERKGADRKSQCPDDAEQPEPR
jgi:hypothetical protein